MSHRGGTPILDLVRERWVHIGRLWTNGDPFLAVDAAFRSAWRGFSEEQYDEIVHLGPQHTSVAVGAGRAVLVGADGVVGDDSWMEVFEAEDGALAVVQAAGLDYRQVVASALAYPDTDDDEGDLLVVDSRTGAVQRRRGRRRTVFGAPGWY